jgi:hypothetical protein
MVTEEADETVGWLELISELDLARGAELTWLLAEARELVAIFGSSYATAKAKDRGVEGSATEESASGR